MKSVKVCLANEERPISGLYGPNGEWQITVNDDFEPIVAYLEDDNSPWFAVFRKGQINQRINARWVEAVVYF